MHMVTLRSYWGKGKDTYKLNQIKLLIINELYAVKGKKIFLFSQGSIRVVEEYRNKSSADDPLECYYLFQLNNDAACSVQAKHLSPASITLIM